jgi:hypothetical protein
MEWSQTDSFQKSFVLSILGSKEGKKTHGKAELTLNSMNPKTSNNQPKLINIQLDCYFRGKITTSDDEVMEKIFSVGRRHPQEMPIKTSNLADNL